VISQHNVCVTSRKTLSN